MEAVGEITSQTLSGDTLTIGGTNLPTTDVRVRFANSECSEVTASATEITCTLNFSAAAGSWSVRVSDANGLTPLATDVTLIDVGLTVDSVAPSTGLNQLGGDILTLTGTGFDIVTSTSTVVFSDGTVCNVQTSEAT